MALTYSLKYKKLNARHRTVLEKEGEIVLDRHSFKLKGKGARDHGETLYLGDVRELRVKDETLSFATHRGEKYILCDFSSLFHVFLKDFVRIRNEYLADSLSMKVGMLLQEYDGGVDIVSPNGTLFSKGKSRIQIYEGSVVILPEVKECFSIHFSFLKNHEFDEDEYMARLSLENGQVVSISKLGTSFPDFQEQFEKTLGKMYEKLLNLMTEFLAGFPMAVLLKLAHRIRKGRFLSLQPLKKLDATLPSTLGDILFSQNDAMKERAAFLRTLGGEENFFASFRFCRSRESGTPFLHTWFLQGIPSKNMVALAQTSLPGNTVHFFRIITDHGVPQEKLPFKIAEIDQALDRFRFDLTPILKDQRALQKNYGTAIQKLSFLRLLRKSYLGKVSATDMTEFTHSLETLAERAHIAS